MLDRKAESAAAVIRNGPGKTSAAQGGLKQVILSGRRLVASPQAISARSASGSRRGAADAGAAGVADRHGADLAPGIPARQRARLCLGVSARPLPAEAVPGVHGRGLRAIFAHLAGPGGRAAAGRGLCRIRAASSTRSATTCPLLPGQDGFKLASRSPLWPVWRTPTRSPGLASSGASTSSPGWTGTSCPRRRRRRRTRGRTRRWRTSAKRRAEALKFIRQPDPNYFSFQSFMKAAMEEIFVFDALSLLQQPKRGRGWARASSALTWTAST